MKGFLTSLALAAGLFAATASNAATVSINFNSLPQGDISSGDSVAINSFTTLSTDGFASIGSSIFGGDAITIGAAGNSVFFVFDTSAVAVSNVTLSGRSNNAPVDIAAFDLNGSEVDFFQTDNNWTSAVSVSSLTPISAIDVLLLESEISSLSITYETVSAVPVPAAVWLFGSGLIGLAGVARRKRA